jgi:hypothetical protein
MSTTIRPPPHFGEKALPSCTGMVRMARTLCATESVSTDWQRRTTELSDGAAASRRASAETPWIPPSP